MPIHLIAFLAAAAIDSIPVFAPPSWTALLYLRIRYGLGLVPLTVLGVAGSTAGRLLLTVYIHRAAELILSRHEEHNIEYLGKKMGRNFWADFPFIFAYCLTPLSTSPLFMAAALAGVRRRVVFPPFVLGKLICYGIILYGGRHAAVDAVALFHGKFSLQGVLVPVVGLAALAGMLFIDWRALLRDKKLRLDFKILRGPRTVRRP